MEAQVIDLEKAGIRSCLVGSAQSDRNILLRVQKKEFSIIYCSPEYLNGNNCDQLLNILKDQLLFIAIDGKCKMNKFY